MREWKSPWRRPPGPDHRHRFGFSEWRGEVSSPVPLETNCGRPDRAPTGDNVNPRWTNSNAETSAVRPKPIDATWRDARPDDPMWNPIAPIRPTRYAIPPAIRAASEGPSVAFSTKVETRSWVCA